MSTINIAYAVMGAIIGWWLGGVTYRRIIRRSLTARTLTEGYQPVASAPRGEPPHQGSGARPPAPPNTPSAKGAPAR